MPSSTMRLVPVKRRRGRPANRSVGVYQRNPITPAVILPLNKLKSKSKSYTQTTSKTKSKVRRGKFIKGVPSITMFKHYQRPAINTKLSKQVTTPWYYTLNLAADTKCDEGTQAVFLYRWNNVNDLTTILNKVPQPEWQGTSPPVANQALTKVSKKLIVEKINGELMFTNSSLALAFVEIYDIARKRDCTNAVANSDPISAWKWGEANIDDSGVASDSKIKLIGSYPTESYTFNKYFKIVQKSAFALQPGSTHKHIPEIFVNRQTTSEYVGEAQGDIAGLTFYTMIVYRGQPCTVLAKDSGQYDPSGNPILDASGNMVTDAINTTAAISLDLFVSQRIKYSFNISNSTYKVATNLVQSAVGETVVNSVIDKLNKQVGGL